MTEKSSPVFLFISLLIAGLITISCSLSQKESFTKTPTYTFQQHRQIAVDTMQLNYSSDSLKKLLTLSVEPGNKIVFHYKYKVSPPEGVVDGGSTESIYFELPEDKKAVDLKNEELVMASVYFRRSCFCRRIGALKVTEGYLKGEKISFNLWSIRASLHAETENESFDVKFSDVFLLVNQVDIQQPGLQAESGIIRAETDPAIGFYIHRLTNAD